MFCPGNLEPFRGLDHRGDPLFNIAILKQYGPALRDSARQLLFCPFGDARVEAIVHIGQQVGDFNPSANTPPFGLVFFDTLGQRPRQNRFEHLVELLLQICGRRIFVPDAGPLAGR